MQLIMSSKVAKSPAGRGRGEKARKLDLKRHYLKVLCTSLESQMCLRGVFLPQNHPMLQQAHLSKIQIP